MIMFHTVTLFADDTTLIGLITGNDETDYRNNVSTLTEWSCTHNVKLNVAKEIVFDFRRGKNAVMPLTINDQVIVGFLEPQYLHHWSGRTA